MAVDPVALAKMAEYQQGHKEEEAKETADIFEQADANKDGLLNVDEYVRFQQLSCARETEQYGDAINFTDEAHKRQYELYYNKITPEVDGISLADMQLCLAIFDALSPQ